MTTSWPGLDRTADRMAIIFNLFQFRWSFYPEKSLRVPTRDEIEDQIHHLISMARASKHKNLEPYSTAATGRIVVHIKGDPTDESRWDIEVTLDLSVR